MDSGWKTLNTLGKPYAQSYREIFLPSTVAALLFLFEPLIRKNNVDSKPARVVGSTVSQLVQTWLLRFCGATPPGAILASQCVMAAELPAKSRYVPRLALLFGCVEVQCSR